jgi:hypothetical protein
MVKIAPMTMLIRLNKRPHASELPVSTLLVCILSPPPLNIPLSGSLSRFPGKKIDSQMSPQLPLE